MFEPQAPNPPVIVSETPGGDTGGDTGGDDQRSAMDRALDAIDGLGPDDPDEPVVGGEPEPDADHLPEDENDAVDDPHPDDDGLDDAGDGEPVDDDEPGDEPAGSGLGDGDPLASIPEKDLAVLLDNGYTLAEIRESPRSVIDRTAARLREKAGKGSEQRDEAAQAVEDSPALSAFSESEKAEIANLIREQSGSTREAIANIEISVSRQALAATYPSLSDDSAWNRVLDKGRELAAAVEAGKHPGYASLGEMLTKAAAEVVGPELAAKSREKAEKVRRAKERSRPTGQGRAKGTNDTRPIIDRALDEILDNGNLDATSIRRKVGA
jgi:hypothetical protein